MSIIMALIFALSASSIVASSAATLPDYLPQVSTTQAPSQGLSDLDLEDTTDPAPQALTQPLSQAPAVAPRCEEDMPCWDCKVMGNRSCGPVTAPHAPSVQCEEDMECWDCTENDDRECIDGTPVEVTASQAPLTWDCDTLGQAQCTDTNLQDAWESFDTLDIDLDGTGEQMITYVGKVTAEPASLPTGQFSIPSISYDNTIYIFEYQNIYTA